MDSSGVNIYVNYVFRFQVPVSDQSFYVNPQATSFYKLATDGTTELLEVRSGQVLEEVNHFLVPTGWTTAQVKTELIQEYSSRAVQLSTLPNPFRNYGISWDGSIWSV